MPCLFGKGRVADRAQACQCDCERVPLYPDLPSPAFWCFVLHVLTVAQTLHCDSQNVGRVYARWYRWNVRFPFSSLSRGHLEETHTLFPLHKFCEILPLLSQERRSSVQVSSNYCEDSPWSLVEYFEGPSSHCNINKRSNLFVGAWDFSLGIPSPHLEGGFSWVDWHLYGLSFRISFTYMHALIGN